jgi:hypothetical protein
MLKFAFLVLLVLLLVYCARRHRNCGTAFPTDGTNSTISGRTERACGACSERFDAKLVRGFGRGYAAGAEHMVPTQNVTFRDSLQDRSVDYFYDTRGLTMADYALERKLLAANS